MNWPYSQVCTVLTSTKFKTRYDKLGQYIQWKFCIFYCKNLARTPPRPAYRHRTYYNFMGFKIKNLIVQTSWSKTTKIVCLRTVMNRWRSSKYLSLLNDFDVKIWKISHIKTSIIPSMMEAFVLIWKRLIHPLINYLRTLNNFSVRKSLRIKRIDKHIQEGQKVQHRNLVTTKRW